MSCISQVIFRPPVSTMNEKDHWMWPLALGNAHINKLIRIRGITDSAIRRRRLAGENGLFVHKPQYKRAQKIEQARLLKFLIYQGFSPLISLTSRRSCF